MTLRVSGKNMDIGEVLRGQIAMRVEQAVKRYFDGGFGGYAVVEREGTAFRTHCSLHLDTGVDLQASAIAHDPYASADISSERIEKRLRRYKRKLKERRPAAAGCASRRGPLRRARDDRDDRRDRGRLSACGHRRRESAAATLFGGRCGRRARFERRSCSRLPPCHQPTHQCRLSPPRRSHRLGGPGRRPRRIGVRDAVAPIRRRRHHLPLEL